MALPGGEDAAAADASMLGTRLPKLLGCSFSRATRVLLPGGKTAPIAALKPGDKVIATNTKTGQTSPQTVTAVEVNHDTDLYDLRVKTAHGIQVIHTTASHLFWNPAARTWVPASGLDPGEPLRTADGTTATADGGTTPARQDGLMWDLTIPGDNDQDFYVVADASSPVPSSHAHDEVGLTPVLVHNTGAVGLRISRRGASP